MSTYSKKIHEGSRLFKYFRLDPSWFGFEIKNNNKFEITFAFGIKLGKNFQNKFKERWEENRTTTTSLQNLFIKVYQLKIINMFTKRKQQSNLKIYNKFVQLKEKGKQNIQIN